MEDLPLVRKMSVKWKYSRPGTNPGRANGNVPDSEACLPHYRGGVQTTQSRWIPYSGLTNKTQSHHLMKFTRKTIVLAAAAALPFTLSAQPSGSSSSSSSSGSTNPTGSSSSSSSDRNSKDSLGSSSRSTPSSSTGDSSMSGASYGTSSSTGVGSTPGLQAVTKSSLDTEFTAKDLIDKEVYDRDQKKIGKIVDVVLGAESTPLAFALSENSSGADIGSRSTLDNSAAGGGSSRSETTTANSPKSGLGARGAESGSSSGYSKLSSTSSSQPAVIIAHGGLLKMGQDLVRAPMSRLTYDSSQKHLTLDVSSNEITSLSSTSSASGSSTR